VVADADVAVIVVVVGPRPQQATKEWRTHNNYVKGNRDNPNAVRYRRCSWSRRRRRPAWCVRCAGCHGVPDDDQHSVPRLEVRQARRKHRLHHGRSSLVLVGGVLCRVLSRRPVSRRDLWRRCCSNQWSTTERMLKSLASMSDPVHVVVIDDASTVSVCASTVSL
jgi:hypothetical protein